jgi:hypothetical protein
MGDFSASYTAPDGNLQMIPSGPVELACGTACHSAISLCSQHTLDWSLGFGSGPNGPTDGELSAVETDLDSGLCGTGTAVVTGARVGAWMVQGQNTISGEVDGWTVTGAVIVTSYVRHQASDPLDKRGPPTGTPLESIEGTVSLDLVHTSGATAHVANGAFVLHTVIDELSGWGD